MVSPPSYEGNIHPVVLAAAKLAGATRVFRIGGAQSIAALAYGTETVPHVMKITGPGNTYVTAAKAIVRSFCEIDTEAGPSEVTVIADDTANPRYVAGELLAQAEHDEEACSVLVTTSEALVPKVMDAIEAELESLSRAEIIRTSLRNTGTIIVARDMDEAVRLSNLIAPEHLAIYTENPREVLAKITNAGSIMVGESTTVVFGDYFAGPNHILPTGRRARFASPLTAEDFRKVSSIIEFTPERVKNVGPDVIRLAKSEELTAHARAVEMRQ
jgi:histidinol dehydrogenase